MDAQMKAFQLILSLVAALILTENGALGADVAEAAVWRALPLPNGRASELGVEPDGRLWVMNNQGLYSWNGKGFDQSDKLLTAGTYLSGFYGGGDRPLYVSRPGRRIMSRNEPVGSDPEDIESSLYRLDGGKVHYVAAFYAEVPYELPGLYVSRDGRLFNYGTRFLAVYDGTKWHREEARLPTPLIFDSGKVVYFYGGDNLYSVGPGASISQMTTKLEWAKSNARAEFIGALWGENRALLARKMGRKVHGLDLNTGELVNIERIRAQLPEHAYYDNMFGEPDGAVWIESGGIKGSRLHRIAPNQLVSSPSQLAQLDWGNRTSMRGETTHSGRDGSLWFISQSNGLFNYKQGNLSLYGWRDGLFGVQRSFVGDHQGTIFTTSGRTLMVNRPMAGSLPAPRASKTWEAYPLGKLVLPVRDQAGDIWCCLKEAPDQLSRWNGAKWTRIPLPAGAIEQQHMRMLVDDQQHALLIGPEYRGSAAFDVSSTGVQSFPDLQALLTSAVGRGIRQATPSEGIQNALVRKGQQIWLVYHTHGPIHLFDGKHLDLLHTNFEPHDAYESPTHGVVFRWGQTFYTYDRGQMRSIFEIDEDTERVLWADRGPRIYEEALLKKKPLEHLILYPLGGAKYRAVIPTRQGTEPADTQGLVVSMTVTDDGWMPGRHHTYWRLGPGHSALVRMIGTEEFVCDFNNTPLEDLASNVRDVFEDRVGNLWFNVRSSQRQLICNHLEGFKLGFEREPTRTEEWISIPVKVTSPQCDPEKVRLFWRLPEGGWNESESRSSAEIPLDGDAPQRIELIGMDPHGGLTPDLVSFFVNLKPSEATVDP